MRFHDSVSRSAHLYDRGLITAKEFTNVTLEDLRRQGDVCECGDLRKHHRADMCFAGFKVGMKQTPCACDEFRAAS